jgi:DNA-binding NarL/FixJ family response regulator
MKKITVLIVDDEPLARKFIRRMLENHRSIEIVGECGTEKKPSPQFLKKSPTSFSRRADAGNGRFYGHRNCRR